MKIENNSINPLATPKADGSSPVEKTSRQKETTAAVRVNRDSAEVSERGRLLAKARVSMEEASEVENKRVNELQKQVQDGIYQIPLEQLAKNMIGRLNKE